MRPAILTLGLFLLASPVSAQSYPHEQFEVQPRIPQIGEDKTGIMAPGGWNNPYIIRGNRGTEYEMKSRFPDITPHDGVLDKGTIFNPYEIQPRR